jgi:hypothetical protein
VDSAPYQLTAASLNRLPLASRIQRPWVRRGTGGSGWTAPPLLEPELPPLDPELEPLDPEPEPEPEPELELDPDPELPELEPLEAPELDPELPPELEPPELDPEWTGAPGSGDEQAAARATTVASKQMGWEWPRMRPWRARGPGSG